jgi:hypothetical protein
MKKIVILPLIIIIIIIITYYLKYIFNIQTFAINKRYVVPSKYSPISSSKSWDVLIGVHHVVMIMCHYPVASNAGAELCGAGSALWAIRLSVLGYLCELSNPLMNYRWYLMQTLKVR